MSNPIINRLDEYSRFEGENSTTMTPSGTMTNFFIMTVLLIIPALITWNWAALGFMDRVYGMTIVGVILGLISVLVMTFSPKTSPYLAPIYAVSEGMYLGGLSAVFEMQLKGIVIQAVGATIAVSLAMFALYKFKVITVTEKFRATILTAVTAIFILYMANLILGLFGNHVISNLLWSNTPLAIGISAVICVVAALCLLLDFDRIERFSQYQAPKYMEWYCAMGLMVTIVWLYVEILRLLSILNRR